MNQKWNRKELLVVLVLMLCVFLFAACNPSAYLAPEGVGTNGNAGFASSGDAFASNGNALAFVSDGDAMVVSYGNALTSAGNAAQGN